MVQMKTGISRPLALLLPAALFVGATPPPVQPSPPTTTPDPASMAKPLITEAVIQPFDLDATRRMAVAVMVGGQGPFSFLVDTGAERTIISRELAERLRLNEGEKLRLATISGSSVAPSFRVASLQMATLRLNPFDAPALAGQHIGAAGLVGVDLLQDRRILINFQDEQIQILESRKRARPIIRDDDAIVVEARNQAGRLILSDARIDGKRVRVIVDTGAQTSVGNMALKALVEKRRANRYPYRNSVLTSVTGQTIPGQYTQIRRIAIEGADINDLPVNFADSRAFRALGIDDQPALLLGMDSLRLFDRVEIDFPNHRIVFDMPDAASRDAGQRLALAATRQTG